MSDGWLALVGPVVTPLLTVLLWWLTSSRRDAVRRDDVMAQDLRDRLSLCQEELRELRRDNDRLYRRIALRNGDE